MYIRHANILMVRQGAWLGGDAWGQFGARIQIIREGYLSPLGRPLLRFYGGCPLFPFERRCRISGSGRPLRFEHWGAREIFPLPAHVSKSRKGSRLERRTHKGHEIYTGSGHHCGLIPYSSVWWIASWADDEQYKEEQPREGLFLASATCFWLLGS